MRVHAIATYVVTYYVSYSANLSGSGPLIGASLSEPHTSELGL